MTNMLRIQSVWSGFNGAPGFSNFYASPAVVPEISAAVTAFWGFIADLLPSDVTVTTPNSGDVLDLQSGAIVDTWASSGGAAHTGTDSGGYSAASGALVRWTTSVFVSGRRLQGRTFIVPMGGSSYQNDGTLVAGRQAVLQVGASNLITALLGDMFVWHRPVSGSGGEVAPVTGFVVPDKVSVLRSRRG